MELMESVKEQIDARLSARHWLDEAVAEAESDSSPTEDAWDDEPSPFSAMPNPLLHLRPPHDPLGQHRRGLRTECIRSMFGLC